MLPDPVWIGLYPGRCVVSDLLAKPFVIAPPSRCSAASPASFQEVCLCFLTWRGRDAHFLCSAKPCPLVRSQLSSVVSSGFICAARAPVFSAELFGSCSWHDTSPAASSPESSKSSILLHQHSDLICQLGMGAVQAVPREQLVHSHTCLPLLG